MRESIALATGEAAFAQKPFPKEMQQHQITEGQGLRPQAGSPQVCSSEFTGFSATLIYNEGQGGFPKVGFAESCCISGAESAQLSTWHLLLKSQHCTGPRAEGTCGGSKHW